MARRGDRYELLPCMSPLLAFTRSSEANAAMSVLGKSGRGQGVFDYGLAPVCNEKLNPSVLMMKSAQDGVRIYGAGSLNRRHGFQVAMRTTTAAARDR
jgi:hypothetical protein